jgi:hypothetical protein
MRVCPHCANDDPRLMEPRFLFACTLWLCIVCSMTWKEPVERKDSTVDVTPLRKEL